MKRTKIVILPILILFIVGIISGCEKENNKPSASIDGMVHTLFSNSSEANQKYLENLVQEDGRKIEKDGYDFTIVKEFYDSKSETGCFELRIKSESINKTKYSLQALNKLCIDDRFEICFGIVDIADVEIVNEGNGITVYVPITCKQGFIDNKISINDLINYNYDTDEGKEELGVIELMDSNKHLRFERNDNEEIYISPIGIREELSYSMMGSTYRTNYILNMKDGEKIYIKKDGIIEDTTIGKYSEGGEGEAILSYEFDKIINIDEIESITVDGDVLYSLDNYNK